MSVIVELNELDADLWDAFKRGGEWVTASEYRKLMTQNIKLRELIRDMWRFTGTACKKYPKLFDPAASGSQMVQLNMIDSFEQRLHDFGVEVDG